MTKIKFSRGLMTAVIVGVFGLGYLCGSITQHQAEAQIGGLLEKAAFPQYANDPTPNLAKDMQTGIPFSGGPWILKSFTLGLSAERSLADGRTVRIGNAAQTLHPVAGQGLNLGMRDAFELVRSLAKQRDIDAVLRRLEWQRAPDRWS